MEKEITLLEALTGVDFVVNYLDGTKFRVQNKPGQVIKPDSLMTVEEKGLPFHKTPFKFGNLFILFKVKFPQTLDGDQRSSIDRTLNSMKGKKDVKMDTASEECFIIDYQKSQRNPDARGGSKGDHDEEEDEDDPRMRGGAQRVQCQQQ